MRGSHDPTLVFAAILIAVMASYAALTMAARVTASTGRARLAWLAGGSFVMGTGIWSMHFTAMLAFRLTVPVSYHLPLVLLSGLAAVAASLLALVVVSRPTMGAAQLAIGGLLMGPAIAGMHYIGMAAMRLPARISYDPFLLWLSVVIAVVASWAALHLAFRFRDAQEGRLPAVLGSAVLMGMAISGMHFTGMAAATFALDPGATRSVSGALLHTSGLATGVVLGALVILGIALLTARREHRLHRRFVEPLRDTRERFRALVEHSAVGVWQVDREGRTLYANPALLHLLELDGINTLDDRTHHEFFPPESLARIEEEEGQRAEGAASTYEVELRTATGRRRQVLISGAPVFGARGELQSTMGSLVDITDRKELEARFQEARKMESVGRLAGGVAHDFNNILAGILGAAELALAELPDGLPARSDLEDIRSAARRAARLTEQLTTFSRRHSSSHDACRANAVVVENEEPIRQLVPPGVVLRTELGLDVKGVPLGAADLEQILLNLALNARDAMPKGGTITIRTRRVEIEKTANGELDPGLPAGGYVEISVSDTGVGMDVRVRQRIFEPFFTTKELGGGAGLGLALVYGIVKEAGGALLVESHPGAGSTLTLLLPAIDGPLEEALDATLHQLEATEEARDGATEAAGDEAAEAASPETTSSDSSPGSDPGSDTPASSSPPPSGG